MSVAVKRLAELGPKARAIFASTSRLLSCLVTESLLRAFYFSLEGFGAITGFCVILSHDASLDEGRQTFTSKDIFAIASLRHTPILRHNPTCERLKEISLLDPLDMAPLILRVDHGGSLPLEKERKLSAEHAQGGIEQAILVQLSQQQWPILPEARMTTSCSTSVLWEAYGQSIELESAILLEISKELANSEKWQQHSYENPCSGPQFSDPSIIWEQSIIEGHPTHPMHKTRLFLPPIPDHQPGEYDFNHPKLRLISIPRSEMHIIHDFESYTKPLMEAMSKKAGRALKIPEDHVAVPVYELQLLNIQSKFESAVVYPDVFSLHLLAQQSIRSVIVPNILHDLSLKLSVGLKLTSVIRTIFVPDAFFGPGFSKEVVPLLTMDPNIITVARELASVIHAHPDRNVAMHCSAIIRECHENLSEKKGERHIVCTTLVESGHSGEGGDISTVIRVFELNSEDKMIQWLTNHDIDVVYNRMYHTLFHNHLQQLIRVLGLHYNGKGWQVVREQLEATIPKNHRLYEAWLSPDRTTVPGKCFLRMRMTIGEAGWKDIVRPFPNVVQYRGVDM